MERIIKKTILICICLFSINTGCKKELETTMYGQYSSVDFPKTETDINGALIPLYAALGAESGPNPGTEDGWTIGLMHPYVGYGYWTSMITDEFLDLWGMGTDYYTFGADSWKSDGWNWLYGKIRFVARATDVIDKIEKAPVNESIKPEYLAEAKGLRAWLMYALYDMFGPLNVKLDPAKLGDNTIEPRLTKEAYIAAIEKDITEAIPDLPDKLNNDSKNWGRLSKGALRMVLLKLYMIEKDWTKAQTVGESLLGMGYELLPSYKNVFMEGNNKELIYAAPTNKQLEADYYNTLLPSDCAEVCGVTVQGGWDGYLMPWDFYDKYDPADQRLETIGGSYITNSGDTKSRSTGLQGAVSIKYLNFEKLNGSLEFVFFRYADVLLSMAEILNELNGPNAQAIGYAQQVTDRAGTSIPPAATTSKESFRDFLLDERGRELYMEPGIRRQDLIRHGKLISNAHERGKSAAQDYQILFPIPSDVIIEGGGIIVQNPGYN